MSGRLDEEREAKLQPKRVEYAKEQLKALGIEITFEDKTRIDFMYEGHKVSFWPYSGWHTGKSIVDGRGIHKLLKQLKK